MDHLTDRARKICHHWTRAAMADATCCIGLQKKVHFHFKHLSTEFLEFPTFHFFFNTKGNVTVVSELLRGGTYRSIDAKNEVGQTAIHLAASLGNAVILKILIQGGGNVNIKDDADLTALHVININSYQVIIVCQSHFLSQYF